uniref:Versiconal hemiacetal acetate reductase-like n=1 Tax=Saccoglossus kowalevskii TaxID=10224 RepID=A0ABM0M8Y4_SACKO|nr:PREDICTED: versiconal hemiacetal acetate reductase-like [Saccoglossus kowalevskii]
MLCFTFRKQRDRFIVTTKPCYMQDKSYSGVDNVGQYDPNTIGLSRKHLIRSVDESLRRLKTDYIDLYQIHVWDEGTPIEETIRTLDDLIKAGKIRYVGAGNVLGWQMQKIMMLCKSMGVNPWISLASQYSLLCRWPEWELLDVCRNEGVGVMAWSPLKGGWLTGKIKRDSSSPPEGSRIAFSEANPQIKQQSHPNYSKYSSDGKVFDLLDTMERIGQKHDKTISQVALRWLLQKDTVSAAIIGAKTLQQLDENMVASAGWELSEKQMSELDDASAVEVPYPYELVARANKSRRRFNNFI